jgi:anti-sigma B factor antagonist
VGLVIDLPPTFALATEHVLDGSYVVRVTGELDLYTSPDLEEALASLVVDGATDVVVDLTEVPFLDSSGLAVLLTAARRLGRERFTLTGVGLEPRRVLEITGADGLLRIADEATKVA